MDVSGDALWLSLISEAKSDQRFRRKAKHLSDVRMGIRIGEGEYTIRLNRGSAVFEGGRPIEGWSCVISGPREEWVKLMSGEKCYAQAINSVHGKLKVEGDFLVHAWATEAMWELFKISKSISRSEVIQ